MVWTLISEKKAEGGKGSWERGWVDFRGQGQLWLPWAGLSVRPQEHCSLGSPCSCGHGLSVCSMCLSAAQAWLLTPLNWEMSCRAKFRVRNSLFPSSGRSHFFQSLSPRARVHTACSAVILYSSFECAPGRDSPLSGDLSEVAWTPWAFCKVWGWEFISEERSPLRFHTREGLGAPMVTAHCHFPFPERTELLWERWGGVGRNH